MTDYLVSRPQLEILRSDKQVNLFLAGVGSGKTFLDGIISYRNIRKYPAVRGFIGANTYDQLNTSTMYRIREVWKLFGITEYSEKTGTGHYVVNKQPPATWPKSGHNFITYGNIISFINGAVVFIGSLDNAKAHEGKEFGWAVLDETKDTKEEAVKEVILNRLRQPGMKDNDGKDWNPLYISTTPAKVDWINTWFELEKDIAAIEEKIYTEDDYFVKSFGNKFCVISSTHHNAPNLPENYIENKRQDLTAERFKTLIHANPFSQSGGEYYGSFQRLTHVGRCEYNAEIPLHITFDFNTVPYAPAALFQITLADGRYKVSCVDEFAIKPPKNSTEELCEAILGRYGHHKSGCFIYGDATGRKREQTSRIFKHNIQVLETVLRPIMSNYSMRIPAANPANNSRRDFMNRIFEGKTLIDFLIDEKCKHVIADMTYTKQDSITGGKDKHRVKDADTGDVYEKYGHFGDATEYFLCEAFKKIMKV